MLRADGHYIVGSGGVWNWELKGGASDFVQSAFETLARHGAFEIADATASDLLTAWLEALRQERCGFRFGGYFIEHSADGSEGAHHQIGSIDRLCEASAKFCRILEARALQAQFEEKQRHDPKNWSRLRQQFEAFKKINITEMPDNVNAAAIAMAFAAGGACKAVQTTVLLSVGEAVEAMKKASQAGYQPATATSRAA